MTTKDTMRSEESPIAVYAAQSSTRIANPGLRSAARSRRAAKSATSGSQATRITPVQASIRVRPAIGGGPGPVAPDEAGKRLPRPPRDEEPQKLFFRVKCRPPAEPTPRLL